MGDSAIAVMVNGLPLYTVKSNKSWNNEGEYHYNIVEQESNNEFGHAEIDRGLLHYHVPSNVILGGDTNTFDPNEHSPIIGWALDGLPIYGPYGYSDPNDVNSDITNIQSAYDLRSGTRQSGPGGAHTGIFVEDYVYNSSKGSQDAYADKYNMRYARTPDSPNFPINVYVATQDDEGNPQFPYAVGGGTRSFGGSNAVWANKFFHSSEGNSPITEIVVTEAGGQYTTATATIEGDGSGATAP